MNRREALILGIAFLIFLEVRLPQTANYPYYRDDFYSFQRAQEVRQDLSRSLAPVGPFSRRFPLFHLLLALETFLFGFGPTPYFIFLFLFHFLNSILVLRLARSLGARENACLISAVFFLITSASYQNLIFIFNTQRVFCHFLLLLATLSWITFLRSLKSAAFGIALTLHFSAILFMEDAYGFPFLAFFLVLRLLPPGKRRNEILIRWLPWFFLLDLLQAPFLLQNFFSSPFRSEKLAFSHPVIPKFLSLLKMLFQPLGVPEKGVFPSTALPESLLRLVPALLIGACFGLFFKGRQYRSLLSKISKPLFFTALGWIVISILPFLFQPLTFEHASRYLYWPLMGFSFILGELGAAGNEVARQVSPRLGRKFWLAVFVYVGGLNLLTTAHHYQRYVRYVQAVKSEGYFDRVKALFERVEVSSQVGP